MRIRLRALPDHLVDPNGLVRVRPGLECAYPIDDLLHLHVEVIAKAEVICDGVEACSRASERVNTGEQNELTLHGVDFVHDIAVVY